MSKDMTVKLYFEGFSSSVKKTMVRYVETMNRLGRYSETGIYTWVEVEKAEHADILCLGDKHTLKNSQIICPVLFNGDISFPQNIISSSFEFPVTALTLIGLLKRLLEEQEAEVQQQPPVATHNVMQRIDELLQRSLAREKKEKEELATQQTKEEQPEINKYSFEQYLSYYLSRDQRHCLKWKNHKVWFNRLHSELFTTCKTQDELLKLLSSKEDLPEVLDWEEPTDELTKFSLESVLWSYGLHCPIFDLTLNRLNAEGLQVRLKRWPLFGNWETSSELLMLTTLFSRKSTSIYEATVKLGGEHKREVIQHFLFAAELVGLPLDYQTVEHEEQHEISSRKNVDWINSLRKKFDMQNVLAGNVS